jgi:hypothetical protein
MRSRSFRQFRHKPPMATAPAQPRLPQIAPRSPAVAWLPMNPFGPAAAKPSANWDAHHTAAPHRRRSPKVPGFPRRSEASRSSTIVAVAPDPTESKPCSRSLICLLINQQTVAGKVAARKVAPAGGLPIFGPAGNSTSVSAWRLATRKSRLSMRAEVKARWFTIEPLRGCQCDPVWRAKYSAALHPVVRRQ